jgi:hypothetical protein
MAGQSPLHRVPAARQDAAASIRSQILSERHRRHAHRDAEQDGARQCCKQATMRLIDKSGERLYQPTRAFTRERERNSP